MTAELILILYTLLVFATGAMAGLMWALHMEERY